MVSFTQLVATAIATAALVVAAPTPVTPAAPVTTESAPLQIEAGGALVGVVTAEGAFSLTGVAGTFTVERDPSNTNNVLITSDLGPCGVEATVFVCSAKTTAASFGFATFGSGLDLTNGGVLSFNGVSFSVSSGAIVNVADAIDGENLLVGAPATLAARATKETAPLAIEAAGSFAPGVITAAGAYSITAAAGTFTVERDPSNTDNVLITSTLGPCGVEAGVFVCSASTTAASFGFASFSPGLDLTNGGVLSFNGVGFSVNDSDAIVNVADDNDGENLLVASQ